MNVIDTREENKTEPAVQSGITLTSPLGMPHTSFLSFSTYLKLSCHCTMRLWKEKQLEYGPSVPWKTHFPWASDISGCLSESSSAHRHACSR